MWTSCHAAAAFARAPHDTEEPVVSCRRCGVAVRDKEVLSAPLTPVRRRSRFAVSGARAEAQLLGRRFVAPPHGAAFAAAAVGPCAGWGPSSSGAKASAADRRLGGRADVGPAWPPSRCLRPAAGDAMAAGRMLIPLGHHPSSIERPALARAPRALAGRARGGRCLCRAVARARARVKGGWCARRRSPALQGALCTGSAKRKGKKHRIDFESLQPGVHQSCFVAGRSHGHPRGRPLGEHQIRAAPHGEHRARAGLRGRPFLASISWRPALRTTWMAQRWRPRFLAASLVRSSVRGQPQPSATPCAGDRGSARSAFLRVVAFRRHPGRTGARTAFQLTGSSAGLKAES